MGKTDIVNQEELRKLFLDQLESEVDEIPPDFYDAVQWARILRKSEAHTRNLLKRHIAAGKVEVLRLRAPIDGNRTPLPHNFYKLKV